jgi:hypothetical protein
MSVSKEEFVCHLPSNRFYWKVDGTRWLCGGLKRYIGEDGIAWIVKHQGATTYDELKQMLGLPTDARLFKTSGWERKGRWR